MARVSRQSARRFCIIPQVDIESQGQAKGLARQWGTEEKAGQLQLALKDSQVPHFWLANDDTQTSELYYSHKSSTIAICRRTNERTIHTAEESVE